MWVGFADQTAADELTDDRSRDRPLIAPGPHRRLVNRPVTGQIEHLTPGDGLNQSLLDRTVHSTVRIPHPLAAR
ncbi:hypothetical protein Raf01_75920 [Rugosimonospora africana]|uniref:Uncharacterized protein n=1 Tax=Rugosimonospora africana TaxID=556532 RepID=A0A8J3VUM4_9ACTN|nr:hypothetical protein Raf01_75920 [Rugosimonospora africana]